MNDRELDAKLNLELQRQIDELPKQMKPSRDLWAGIDHAIEQQQSQQYSHNRFSWQKLSAVAASFAVLGFTAWLTFNANFPMGELTADSQGSSDNLQYVSQMTQSFETQKQALLVKYEDQTPNADNWRVQLKELDGAAVAIKKALDQDPTNAQLIKMLQQTYQQQLDLIKAVNKSPWQTI